MTEVEQRPTRAARAAAKRAQIRAAASALFRANGFEQTSMDDITAAARVSKRTLYKYYSGKEALLGDIVHQLTVARDRQDSTPAPPITTACELEAVLFQVATLISANHRTPEFLGLVRVMIAETPRYPDLALQYNAAVIEPGMATLRAIFDRARAGGV